MCNFFTSVLLLCVQSITMRGLHFDGDLLKLPQCPKLAGVLLCLLTLNCFLLTDGNTPTCVNGIIEPQNPYFWIGEEFTLTCTAEFNTSRLKFKTLQQEEFKLWNVTSAGTNAIKLTGLLEPGNKKDSFMIQCMDVTPTGENCLYNEYMDFEYRPVEPKEVKLRILNWRTMWLTWNLGQDYFRDNLIHVHCSYAAANYRHNGAKDFVTCPMGSSNASYWNESMYTDPDLYSIRISVTNLKTNVTATVENDFERDFNVELNPLWMDKVEETKPGCVYVQWQAPIRSGLYFQYKLSYESDCDDAKEEYIEETAVRIVNTTLCDLTPNANYTFKLQGSVYKNGKAVGYWSEPTNKTLHIESQVPTSSPAWTRGLYENINDDIRIYFQLSKKCDFNANSVWYTLSSGDKVLDSVQHPHFFVTISHKSMFNSTSNLLLLRTNNTAGSSNISTLVTVFARDNKLKPSHMHVEYSQIPSSPPSCLNISINITLAEENTLYSNLSHTLVYRNKSGVFWKDISSFSVMEECYDYKYGLITKGYDRKAGVAVETSINWNDCLYQRNKVAQLQKEMFSIEGGFPGSVKIDWKLQDCHPAYIEQYNIRYCPIGNTNCKCADDSPVVTIPGTQKSHILEQLTVNKICVTIEAHNPYGVSSPIHLGPVDVLPIQSSSEIQSTVWISTVVGVVFVVAVILSLFRCLCYPKIKSKMRRPEIRDIEDTPDFHFLQKNLLAKNKEDLSGVLSSMNDSGNGSSITQGSQEEVQPLIGTVYQESSASGPSNRQNIAILSSTEPMHHRVHDEGSAIGSSGYGRSSENPCRDNLDEKVQSDNDLEDNHGNQNLVPLLMASDDITVEASDKVLGQDTITKDSSRPIMEPGSETCPQTTDTDLDTENSENLYGCTGGTSSSVSCLDGYETVPTMVINENPSHSADFASQDEDPILDNPSNISKDHTFLETTDTTETCWSGSTGIISCGSGNIDQNLYNKDDAILSHRQSTISDEDGYNSLDSPFKNDSSSSYNSVDSGYAQVVSKSSGAGTSDNQVPKNKQDNILCFHSEILPM